LGLRQGVDVGAEPASGIVHDAADNGIDASERRTVADAHSMREVEHHDRDASRSPLEKATRGLPAVRQQQVIAHGEVGTARRRATDGVSAFVFHPRLARQNCQDACAARTKAELEIFEREEVILVQQTSLLEGAA
jgi:hypothetical protein